MLRYLSLALLAAVGFLANCRHETGPEDPGPQLPPGTSFIEPSSQRNGDPAAGYQYLIYGDYVSSGIPLPVFKQIFGANSPDDLGRTGDADGIPYRFNVVNAANGVKVVAPTCLVCHAEYLNGQLLVGLGNNSADYTTNQGSIFQTADLAVRFLYGENSPEWAAYWPASRAYQAIGPYILTKARGVNPADKIFATLSAHRQQASLQWVDQQQFGVPLEVAPSDVPAWWLMKKKNALYYNGLGKGDFGRLSGASGMLTMADSAEARRIDQRFPDLMAWIRSLEPPAYPYPIDQTLAAEGKMVFEKNCSQCHGRYGDQENYPNLLVSLEQVGTDPALAQVYQNYPQYHNWYNDSWYAKGPSKGQLLPNTGYVAPPLDGIWATAPYLHNGSVPTLDDLLYSPQRPALWRRSFSSSDYNLQKVGWNYETPSTQADANTYNTVHPGYGNQGHRFGDALSAADRRVLLEYLKTL
jgi:mono/diheme cytochrome c family protein